MLDKQQLTALSGMKIADNNLFLTFYKSGYICVYTGVIAFRMKCAMDISVDCQIPLGEVKQLGELVSLRLEKDMLIVNEKLTVAYKEPWYRENSMRVFDVQAEEKCSDYNPDLIHLIGKISSAFTERKFFHIKQHGDQAGVVDLTDDVRIVIMPVKL